MFAKLPQPPPLRPCAYSFAKIKVNNPPPHPNICTHFHFLYKWFPARRKESLLAVYRCGTIPSRSRRVPKHEARNYMSWDGARKGFGKKRGGNYRRRIDIVAECTTFIPISLSLGIARYKIHRFIFTYICILYIHSCVCTPFSRRLL